MDFVNCVYSYDFLVCFGLGSIDKNCEKTLSQKLFCLNIAPVITLPLVYFTLGENG